MNSHARPAVVFLTISIWLFPAHRMPAPIVEPEAKPTTPAAEKPEAPKRKRSTKSTTELSSQAAATPAKLTPPPVLEGPARFAGTWSGKVNQGLLGHVESTITVDSNASSVELGQKLGGGTKHVKTNGNTISWKTGVMGEVAWTLTPDSDGQTAQVTMKGLLLNDTTTFRRGQIATAPSTPSPPLTRSTSSGEQSSAAGGSMTGPRPKYTQAMRDAHLTGTGTYLLHFDTSTGNVADVTVTQSSGSAILDQAAMDAFRQWREQPNGKKEFPLTISFP